MNKILKAIKPFFEKFPRLAMTLRYIRDNQLIKEPISTQYGFKLIGNKLMEQNLFEIEETKLVKQLLNRIDVFINVGANIGYYCLLSLSGGKHTIAFEPMDINLRYLYKNVKANHFNNSLEIYPIALSNKIDIVKMYGSGTGASIIKGWAGISEQYITYVPASTMDIVLGRRFFDKICFILVDIEGAEMMMLEGAGSFLSRNPKPIWMVEISIVEHQPNGILLNPNLLETFEIFWKNGYEAWTANNEMHTVHRNDIKKIINTGEDTINAHNFLFIEAGKKSSYFS